MVKKSVKESLAMSFSDALNCLLAGKLGLKFNFSCLFCTRNANCPDVFAVPIETIVEKKVQAAHFSLLK